MLERRTATPLLLAVFLAPACGGAGVGAIATDAGGGREARSGDGGGGACAAICSYDKMTVRNCTTDGTPGPAVLDTCDPAAGETCVYDHCANACDAALTETSNEGCEFYPLHLWNSADDVGGNGPFGVIAANTSTTTTATVTLEDASGFSMTQAVPPGSSYTFVVPTTQDRLDRTEYGPAFHLRSTAPIAAYEYNPVNAAQVQTGSASLLLPTHTLSTHYFVLSYTYNACITTADPQQPGYLAVVGTRPNTKIHIKVPVATAASPDGRIPALPPGGAVDLIVGRGEAFEINQVNSFDDMTGAEITASEPVVAFGGTGLTTVPDKAPGGDHFEAQLFPTTTWGKSFECEKYTQRSPNDVDYWRIIARNDDTVVTLSDPSIATVPTLSSGQMFELSTAKNFELTSTQPILVGHYLEAWGALSGMYDPAVFPDPTNNPCPYAGMPNDSQCLGDANMTLAVPTEQYRTSYVFYTPTSYAYDYVDVIAPLAAKILLDGKAIPALVPFASGKYGLAQIRTIAGTHAITGGNPFGISLYGYDFAVSYTYVGGLDLKVLGIP